MSQSSASCRLHSFLDAMLAYLQEHLCVPTKKGQYAYIRIDLTSFIGFPDVCGGMDCTYIAQISPLVELQAYYK